MNSGMLTEHLQKSFGTAVRVRARRPGALLQVELPAFLGDGDTALVFLRWHGDQVTVTDLGHVCMRLSYRRELGKQTDAVLERLSSRHGFQFREGEISVRVPLSELLPALFGLVQIESQADAMVEASVERAERSESFRVTVREALRELFAERCLLDFHDEEADPDSAYALDALIQGPVDLGVAIVPSDVEAERAVASKLFFAGRVKSPRRWVAIPRNVEDLRAGSRKRLLREYLLPVPVYAEEAGRLGEKLNDLAAT